MPDMTTSQLVGAALLMVLLGWSIWLVSDDAADDDREDGGT